MKLNWYNFVKLHYCLMCVMITIAAVPDTSNLMALKCFLHKSWCLSTYTLKDICFGQHDIHFIYVLIFQLYEQGKEQPKE